MRWRGIDWSDSHFGYILLTILLIIGVPVVLWFIWWIAHGAPLP